MTGRINFTPEAERQLNELDDWIAKVASADSARRFVSAILDHIDGILVFALAGRARDDVRPGLRTTTFRKRTLVAYLAASLRQPPVTPAAPSPESASAATEDRPLSSASERLTELKSLLDQGLVTRSEYDERRKTIIDTV